MKRKIIYIFSDILMLFEEHSSHQSAPVNVEERWGGASGPRRRVDYREVMEGVELPPKYILQMSHFAAIIYETDMS